MIEYFASSGPYPSKGNDPAKLAAYKAKVAKSCAPETFAKHRADWGAVFDVIYKLRAGRPVVLRATDFYLSLLREWENKGVRDVCTACVNAEAQMIHEVAVEYGVPVASTMDDFNGTDRGADPVEKGYIKQMGTWNSPSAAGAQRLAEALRQTGYGYSGK